MENLLGSKEGQLRWKKLNVSRPWGRRKDGPSSSETDRSTESALERWERWWWGGAGVGSPEPGSTSLIVLDYGFGFDSTWDG